MPSEYLTSRQKFCAAHRLGYFEQFIPGPNVWSGECPDCEKENRLVAEADHVLFRRTEELEKLIADDLADRGENIVSETERLISEYIEEARAACVEYRSQFEDAARVHIESELRRHYQNEMRTEILSQLRTQQPVTAAER